ncbi:double zinc ribbon domain-containing protein [Shewanella putrefaciens]|uniref:ComF family protein n=1 Tax=Shewanella putrefaciens TaxID=24 RepID=UPI0021C13425|nr:double zinc ribbon domain-containing protein [Shewanella putrefaciens]UXK08784.1 double zinc ribbon domain-containing protein [Shewanella putrefaciens]
MPHIVKGIWPQSALRIMRLGYQLCITWLASSLPNRCLLCHQSMQAPETGICMACLQTGLYHSPICLGCGRSMLLEMDYCGACQKYSPHKIVAPCSYHQGLGTWVGAIKYQGQLAALPILCRALVARINHLEQLGLLTLPQAIVPVPLHPKRLQQRGFNQAWLIAHELSQRLQLPLVDQGLTRRQDTRPQAGLNGAQRRRNLQDAFMLDDDFAYQRIALVDDVVTTGTTVAEIARLFEARYVHVQIWCLARAEAPGLLDTTDL